jgi:hypothetical protein
VFATPHGISDTSPAALTGDELVQVEAAAGVEPADQRLSRFEQITIASAAGMQIGLDRAGTDPGSRTGRRTGRQP